MSAKELKLTKVVGTSNPADMLTKNLLKPDMDRHLKFGNLIIRTGRADGSLQVGALTSCSSVRSRVAAALRLAAGSWMIMGTSKVGLPSSSVGGYGFSQCLSACA